MGEYIGASIQLGGRLKAEHVDELIDLLNADGLKADWCGEPTRENLSSEFGDGQINYGNLDDLIEFATRHGLHYRYWCDSGPEWSEQTTIYNPDAGETLEFIGSVGDGLALTEAYVKALGSFAAVMHAFAKAKGDLPPLEIVS